MPGGEFSTISLLWHPVGMSFRRFYANCQHNACDVKINYNIPELQRWPLWTAASSDGQYCAMERTFAWCTTGAILEEIFINDTQQWDATPKGSASDGNCVAMSLKTDESSAQLSLAACSDSKSYMCQVFKLRLPKIQVY
jgi:hypothetical protein